MIKMSGERVNKAGATRQFIALGLSAVNLQKLKEGLPILFEADLLGYKGDIQIFYGETEAKMAAELSHLIGPRHARGRFAAE